MKNKILQRNLLYAAGGIAVAGFVLLIALGFSPRIYMGVSLVAWFLFYFARKVDAKRDRKI
jgi:hypothetical protein